MSKPSDVRGLGPHTPVKDAARTLLAARLADVRVHEAPLAKKRDPDHVHDMRVAARRLRAAMNVFDFDELEGAEPDVKKLQDALGEVRDRHVLLEWLDTEVDAAAIAARIRSELGPHEERLLSAMSRFRRLVAPGLARALEDLAGGKPLIHSRIRKALPRRLGQVRRRMRRLRRSPDAIRAHELRKTVKKLRYEVELVRPALPRTVDGIGEILKPMQELLGELHDHDVRLDLLARAPDTGLSDLRDRVSKARGALMERTSRELMRWKAERVIDSIEKMLATAFTS